jgi:hypothetical protein
MLGHLRKDFIPILQSAMSAVSKSYSKVSAGNIA